MYVYIYIFANDFCCCKLAKQNTTRIFLFLNCCTYLFFLNRPNESSTIYGSQAAEEVIKSKQEVLRMASQRSA